MRFPIDAVLVCSRWHAAYALSYRNLEEMMAGGIELMHMIRKGQFAVDEAVPMLFADQFSRTP